MFTATNWRKHIVSKMFFRFILGVTLAASALTICIVMISNYHTQRERTAELNEERDRAKELFTGPENQLRRADLVVESQRVSGTGRVLETTLLFRPWIKTFSERDVELSIQRVTIPGDTVTIDGDILKFNRNFIENVDFLAGTSLPMFAHLYGEGGKPTEDNLLAPSYSGSSVEMGRVVASLYELRIWSAIRDLMRDPVQAEKNGVTIERKTSASRVVRPGITYIVWLGSKLGVEFEDRPDQAYIVKELMMRAESLDAIATTRPAAALRN